MQSLDDYDYCLPADQIAQQPPARRTDARLLCVQPQRAPGLSECRFAELPALLAPGDLLVLNNTRVMPARLRGRKRSGGAVEVLIERIQAPDLALAHVRANRAPGSGTELLLGAGAAVARVRGRDADLFVLALATGAWADLLRAEGEMPLPPYIRRAPGAAGELSEDGARYQTVFARRAGAVAAPTAGLHFDADLLARLAERGVGVVELTLHVGAGTFAPIRTADPGAHRMHAEWLEVDTDCVERVRATRAAGGRVVAVGTTVVRALETAAADGVLRPYRGDTRLFIRPGFEFRVVDRLITNFHLPRTTLLMLVAAFAGHGTVMAAYRHAVAEGFRFYSYGDAMLLERPLRSAAAAGLEAGTAPCP